MKCRPNSPAYRCDNIRLRGRTLLDRCPTVTRPLHSRYVRYISAYTIRISVMAYVRAWCVGQRRASAYGWVNFCEWWHAQRAARLHTSAMAVHKASGPIGGGGAGRRSRGAARSRALSAAGRAGCASDGGVAGVVPSSGAGVWTVAACFAKRAAAHILCIHKRVIGLECLCGRRPPA